MEHLQQAWHCQQGTLTLPDTWFPYLLGLVYTPAETCHDIHKSVLLLYTLLRIVMCLIFDVSCSHNMTKLTFYSLKQLTCIRKSL